MFCDYIFRINNYQNRRDIFTFEKMAVDAASCVTRLIEHQRKFSGQYFYILLNITVILRVFLFFKSQMFFIE